MKSAPPEKSDYDLAVIGGGVNGTAIARDAAGRGLRVFLCEKDDFGAATSGASSKLIHGGLRYLEHYQFGMVRKALKERAVMLRTAPHIVWPLEFVLPHAKGQRPAWMIRAGLFLYDALAGNGGLPKSRKIHLESYGYGKNLSAHYKEGFVYSDAWVEDSRLVVLNALDGAERGAAIFPRTACTGLHAESGYWQLECTPRDKPEQAFAIRAAVVVNAAGPWVQNILGRVPVAEENSRPLRLVKGSHIVVPKLYDGAHAFILQNRDGRIVFVMPYERGRFTLVGTTEQDYQGDPGAAEISDSETDYLLAVLREHFSLPPDKADIVWSFAGVRPLLEEPGTSSTKLGRDYKLVFQDVEKAGILNVYGGKITTARQLGEDAMEVLRERLAFTQGPWTRHSPLPGGDIPGGDFARWAGRQIEKFPEIPPRLMWHYCRSYGRRAEKLLQDGDLGRHFGDDLYEAELGYLIQCEWARKPDDALWRRTKWGLHIGEETRQKVLEDWPRLVEEYGS